jgi:ATP-dependent DNA helicase PIF1
VTKQRWLDTKVLIIDEISMLSKELFELLDEIARKVFDNDMPFGGMQLIVVGDFMQLPPVQRNESKQFCFQSHVWEASGLSLINGRVHLNQVERQKDTTFVKYLNEVRIGRISQGFINELEKCLVQNKPRPADGIYPTKLYAINKEVDQENKEKLDELPGELYVMKAIDKWKKEPKKSSQVAHFRQSLDLMIPEEIELKIGAQVMLLRNRSKMTFGGYKLDAAALNSNSLVNGSRGKIVSFSESVLRPGTFLPLVAFDNGLRVTIGPVDYVYNGPNGDGEIVRQQIPLKLAW